ncbi:hypothetical protein L2E82_31908 [Cichorium intybus]|uniref:Uncharacterized protein n=1 Tax=Cichorium intybus TaxID=13427 RepID=A0ACB9BG52_CICIN|nr:hypothetical protein L2E82_31908 [Cichorium intybus]
MMPILVCHSVSYFVSSFEERSVLLLFLFITDSSFLKKQSLYQSLKLYLHQWLSLFHPPLHARYPCLI